MRGVLRVLGVASLVVLLAQCAGSGVKGCTATPERSDGACRVGLNPGWYYDDSWKSP